MRAPELPSFDSYIEDTAVTSKVTEFNAFRYEVQYPPKSCLVADEQAHGARANLIDSVVAVLEKTQVRSAHRLKIVNGKELEDPSTEAAVGGVQLDDDRFGFSILLGEDKFVLTREPSSFRDFYMWYRTILPEVAEVELSNRRHFERVTKRNFKPVQAGYNFRAIFSDFRTRAHSRSRELLRNVDVLESLIPSLPATDGNVELSKQDFYRLDLTVSRLDSLTSGAGEPKSRNCWYKLEAPFNENGRFMILSAMMFNSSQESIKKTAASYSDPDISAMDDDLAGDVELALVQFFREKALEEFMGRVLQHWDFNTQRRF